jgi:hypothetical protein
MNAHDVAKESYTFWRSVGYSHEDALAWLAMEDGETSFRLGVVGDHGEAYGPFQHHWIRIALMALPPPKGCGINIKEAWLSKKPSAHLDCLKAAHWESTQGTYKRVSPQLIAAQEPEDKIAVLVRKYEQSSMQDRDIARRLNLYNYWDNVSKTEGWEWP